MIQTMCLTLTVVYFIERLAKYAAVLLFFRRPPPQSSWQPSQISILQPILSGDPTLSQTLEHNLQLVTNSSLEFVWLIDEDDPVAADACQQLIRKHASISIRLVSVPRGGECQSPKMLKLQHGAKVANGDVIADTMLPANGLDECVAHLDDPEVGVVFGLPYYVAFSTWPSSLVSTFVNSNSLLTYIPYTYLTSPFTINGMFYMIRSDCLLQAGGFDGLENILADDFAVAQRFRLSGYRLVQSRLRHGIYTHVETLRECFQLLRRWFVFPRETIMRDLPWRDLVVTYALALVPCFLPMMVLGFALWEYSLLSWTLLMACVALNLSIFLHLNTRYLQHATPASCLWLVPVLQFIVPLHLIIALLMPQRVIWRGHVIKVESGGTFRTLRHRSDLAESSEGPAGRGARSKSG